MKLNKHHLSPPARIELLPLIDVIFLLLIFFIFVMLTMSVKSSIKIELPQLVASKQENRDFLSITIDAKNVLYINEQATTSEQLITQVSALQSIKKIPIMIRGDQKSDLGIALQTLESLRNAGYNEIVFSVEKITQSEQ